MGISFNLSWRQCLVSPDRCHSDGGWVVGGVMLEGKERPSFGLGLAVQILIISELCFM